MRWFHQKGGGTPASPRNLLKHFFHSLLLDGDTSNGMVKGLWDAEVKKGWMRSVQKGLEAEIE